jgi:hypothetical protein
VLYDTKLNPTLHVPAAAAADTVAMLLLLLLLHFIAVLLLLILLLHVLVGQVLPIKAEW